MEKNKEVVLRIEYVYHYKCSCCGYSGIVIHTIEIDSILCNKCMHLIKIN